MDECERVILRDIIRLVIKFSVQHRKTNLIQKMLNLLLGLRIALRAIFWAPGKEIKVAHMFFFNASLISKET